MKRGKLITRKGLEALSDGNPNQFVLLVVLLDGAICQLGNIIWFMLIFCD